MSLTYGFESHQEHFKLAKGGCKGSAVWTPPFGLVSLSHSDWSAQSYWRRARWNGDIEPHTNNKIHRASSVDRRKAADKPKPLFVTLSDQKELYYLTPSGIGWSAPRTQPSHWMKSPDPKGLEDDSQRHCVASCSNILKIWVPGADSPKYNLFYRSARRTILNQIFAGLEP